MRSYELTRLLKLKEKEWDPDDENVAINLNEEDRIYLAKHIEHYDGIIIDLSHDRSEEVRRAIASNKNTPIYILKRLSANDESEVVRQMSNSTLQELSK